MHEWALAEAIISAVSDVAEREKLREVNSVVVVIGELQQVDRNILRFAIEQLKQGKLAGAKFIIRTERAVFTCRACGYKWPFRGTNLPEEVREIIHFIPETSHAYVRCPACGSPDFDLSGGRGVWIASVRGEG
ncbi:MAG: hydrogenase nickel incorporation protein HypA [Candidatus Bathyarchaeia archaeon]|nr:hydrogenase nickel incorporation protein HypA [Candidatus Bathyarchaeota archaeon]